MFHPDVNVWEVVLRVLVVYAGLFILIRLTGKKELGQLAPMDFLAMLMVSETISPALTGGDHSVTTGLVAAASLMAITFGMDRLTYRFKGAARLLHGDAQVIIRDGKVVEQVQEREKLSMPELQAAVRREGLEGIDDVKLAFVETNGRISVIPKESSK
jgi:uncharacterized membrane protein YcaP (DUF421 family)